MTTPHNTVIKLRRKLNYFRRDVRWSSGLDRHSFNSANGGRVLIYHGICLADHLRYNTLFLTLKTFEKQIQLYKKHFNIISLNDFYEQRFSKDKFSVCLTFDDGFANNYKYVLPILEKYQVPASFFITSIREAGYKFLWNDLLSITHRHGPSKFKFRNEEFIRSPGGYISSSTKKFLADTLRGELFESKASLIDLLSSFFSLEKVHEDYWLQMSEEQIKTLADSKWVTVGSHSYYHNDLAKIPGTHLKKDIEGSKQFLENIIHKEVKAFAFPYGSYNKEAVEQVRNAGFTQLLATEFLFPEDANDVTLRERMTINPFISPINQMHANISGNYE